MEAIPGPFVHHYDWATRSCYFRRLYALFVADLQQTLPPGGCLLDIGTGPGHLPQMLAVLRPDLKITAIDLSYRMAALGQRRLRQVNLTDRVTMITANALALPFPAHTFDLAVATMSYHHWREPARGVQEILRVLKPGGRGWLYELDRGVSRAAIRAFARQLHLSLYLAFPAIRFTALHSALRFQDFARVFHQAAVPGWQVEKVHHIFWRAEVRPVASESIM